jgi:hypothetical protein
MSTIEAAAEERLYHRISAILGEARTRIARSVNTAMVHAYWFVGREIVEVEQEGKERAGYGEGVMKRVAARLAVDFGAGFSLTSLKRMRQFYLAFPGGSALPKDADKGSTVLSLSAGSEKGATPLSLSGLDGASSRSSRQLHSEGRCR